ncbi:choice-of-anchor A family protein [Erythrobacter sp. 3-20A1M]|uniref:collagen-binding domain-containing protein n=1 Tax=Erythrobacter sp. 3-20A1M TaxID=2653850 RepID=UPI001BFC7DC0|nr:collagen-binding domain-containing protein [Erythrobacter sp. 3-20A1M]QWC57226.1 choice-of-anchor A family protein [Erythrobacter sp. 3-20A1M]
MRKIAFSAMASVAVTLLATPAAAAPVITGTDAMREWNLIVLGDLKSSSEVEGRTFVGGNLNGNSSNYQIKQVAPSSNGTPGLTVVGDVNGGTKNLQGGANVGGTVNSGFNLNGPAQTVNAGGAVKNTNVNQNTVNQNLNGTNPAFAAGLAAQGNALTQSLGALSTDLSGMTATNIADFTFNRGTFNVLPDSMGQAVFSITGDQLNSIGEIQFNLNGAKTVVINVAGKDIVLNDNFLGNSNGLGTNVLWNFYQATTIRNSTAFYGSVLAPNAAATLGNFIQGSTVVKSAVQNGEVHLGALGGEFNPTAGGVPEPTTWAMLVLGFGLIGGMMRSAKRRPRKAALAA